MFARIGIPTGPDFPADETNPYGFFEDRNVVAYNELLMRGDDSHLSEYKGYLMGRVAHDDAVVKDPRFTEPGVWEKVMPILPRPYRVVVCVRNQADTINSYLKAYGTSRSVAWDWWCRRNAGAEKILKNVFALGVRFEDILADPYSVTPRLADLVHLGPEYSERMADHVQGPHRKEEA